MLLKCARDDCHGECDLGDVEVVAFDPAGVWECCLCGQRCVLPLEYIDGEFPDMWWLIEERWGE